jgi:trans-aconitate 2-methyltransferase
MTEWDAAAYNQQSALQKWLADEHLASLQLEGTERVLDLGCGDGKITAEIADRLPHGSALGVDPSTAMIQFARHHFGAPARTNLDFAVADAAQLPYRNEFDVVVSFNALHWVRDQHAALRRIRDALRRSGSAFLEFVPQGTRTSLEDVIEDTRKSARWAPYFAGYVAPYVHFTPEEYRQMAGECRLRAERIDVEDKRWDFQTREAFVRFACTTFIEWTRAIPEAERMDFINAVLDNYSRVGTPEDANVFKFYQMEVVLRPA